MQVFIWSLYSETGNAEMKGDNFCYGLLNTYIWQKAKIFVWLMSSHHIQTVPKKVVSFKLWEGDGRLGVSCPLHCCTPLRGSCRGQTMRPLIKTRLSALRLKQKILNSPSCCPTREDMQSKQCTFSSKQGCRQFSVEAITNNNI